MKISSSSTEVPVTSIPNLCDEDCSNGNLGFGNFLRNKREDKKLSVRKLASKAKISYAELSRIENGKRPTPSTLRKLSPYLSVPLDQLLITAGYNIQTDTDSPVYVDFNGNEINFKEKALKLYTKDVELFFQLDRWAEHCDKEDSELVNQFIQILERKNQLRREPKTQDVTDQAFLNICVALCSLIQACHL